MRQYDVVIRASLDNSRLRPGARETSNIVDKIRQDAVQGELSAQKQLSAVASLQRQRSAALIAEWRKQQTESTGLKASIQRLTDSMQALGSSSAALQGPMGGVASRMRSLGALAGEASGGLGILGAAMAAIAVGTVGAAVAIYKLTTAVAEADGKFKDLSQQTGFAVETLSALENAASTTGGSIDTVTGALGIFQKNMEEAHKKGSEMSRVFKVLNLDINDNEKALRQSFIALSKMPEGAQQTAIALRLFGRSGKDVLAIIKETGGDIDRLIEKLRAMGVLITGPIANSADELNDSLNQLGRQFMGVARIVATEFQPITTRVIKEFSNLLTENRGTIENWANQIDLAGRGAIRLGGYVLELTKAVTGLASIPIPAVLRVLGSFTGLPAIFTGLQSLAPAQAAGLDQQTQSDILSRMNKLRPKTEGPRIDFGGPDKKTHTEHDASLALLKQLTRQYNDLATSTELEKINLQLLEKEYASIRPEVAAQIRLTAQLIDTRKANDEIAKDLKKTEEDAARATETVVDAIVKQQNAISDLLTGMPEWKREALDFIEITKKQGRAWEESTEQAYLARAGFRAVLEAMKDADTERLADASELVKKTAQDYAGILADVNGKLNQNVQLTTAQHAAQQLEAAGLLDLNDARAQEILAVAQQIDQQNQLILMRDRIRGVAEDISSVFARATERWSNSIGGFFKSIGQGFADLVRQMIARVVFTRLTNVFESLLGRIFGTGPTGGGLLSGGGAGSGLTGGFAGGASPAAGLLTGIIPGMTGGGFLGLGMSGMSVPASSTPTWASVGAQLGSGQLANAASLTGRGSLAAGVGAMLPMLGMGLGTSLGGQSRLGSILGGAGGLIAGGIGAAFLAPGMFAATGMLGSMGPMIAGLLTNPFTAVAAGALIIGAIILSKNKARQQAEKVRNQASLETLPAVYEILYAAQRGELTVSQAKSQFEQVHQRYLASIAGIKDAKTKRNALLWWDQIAGISVDPGGRTVALWPQIEAAAKAGEKSQQFKSVFTPTYSGGIANGLVPYMGGAQTLIKVRPGERIDDVGMIRSWTVPGHDRGVDSVYTMATPGSAVRTRSQQSVPGFANGSGPVGGNIVFKPSSDVERVLLGTMIHGLRSPEGKKIVVEGFNEEMINTGGGSTVPILENLKQKRGLR